MTWSEPERETALSRERAITMLRAGETSRCVWSGQRLNEAPLDINQCLPWTAWPCGVLLPAHRRVNQHEELDRLSADTLLRRTDKQTDQRYQTVAARMNDPAVARARRPSVSC